MKSITLTLSDGAIQAIKEEVKFLDILRQAKMLPAPGQDIKVDLVIAVHKAGMDKAGMDKAGMDKEELKCELCHCKKLVHLFPPDSDICKMCQRDLQWEETLKKQHEAWREEQDNQQDEEAADSECFTTPQGDCVAIHCKLHGPLKEE